MDKFKLHLEKPLLQLFFTEWHTFHALILDCQLPIVLATKRQSQSSSSSSSEPVSRQQHQTRYQLRADYRHTDEPALLERCHMAKFRGPLYLLLDEVNQSVVKFTHNPQKMPKFYFGHNFKDTFFKEENNMQSPQSLYDLRLRLESMGILTTTNVMYRVSAKPACHMIWHRGDPRGTSELPLLNLEAFTKPDLSIGYRRLKPSKSLKKHHDNPFVKEMEARQIDPDPTAKNRKSAVQVTLSGLNLAVALGMCTHQERIDYGKALSQCVGTMWITFDETHHARHVVYRDRNTSSSSSSRGSDGLRLELKPNNHPDNDWSPLFKKIEASRQKMIAAKRDILSPLMAKFQPYINENRKNPLRTKWKTCVDQLQLAINCHKVLLFTNDDACMHAIKIPLASHFSIEPSIAMENELAENKAKKIKMKKKDVNRGNMFRGITVQSLPNNAIVGFTFRGYQFVNLADAFDYKTEDFCADKDDEILWELANEWLSHFNETLYAGPPPCLESSKLHLKNHKCPVKGMGIMPYLYQRGMRNAAAIGALWTALVEFTATHLNYDLSTLLRISYSKQAFDIVWIDYAKRAGPMAHAIEKVHPHTEFLLRPFCTGGFSYSCKDALQQGMPLGGLTNPHVGEIAASIQEFDLTSSYGFSGMSMAAARGFGHTFPNRQFRHRTFEFRAVMYTLYKWTVLENLNVVSVFSNFSPLGIMKIGPYPLDLVAILNDGSIKMLQVDGHFIHGDYNNPQCPGVDLHQEQRYIGGANRCDVEAKTKLRDETILNWMIACSGLPAGTSYTVVTDCCHDEYRPEKLARDFQQIPQLYALISGLDSLRGDGKICLDAIDYSEMTFLAIVTGTCCQGGVNQDVDWGPIFQSKQQQQESQTGNNVTTWTGGRILVTADYYRYLKDNFNFVVTDVEWVTYYKRCHDIPRVFENLLNMRQHFSNGQKSKANIIKGIINKAAGYFGLNFTKSCRTLTRITVKVPQNFNFYRHTITPLVPDYKGISFIMVKTMYTPSKNPYMCPGPLPLFVSIVEYGKLRLNQAIQCLQSKLRPASFRILYSNVDNLVVAFSSNSPYECFKDSSALLLDAAFEWSKFFSHHENDVTPPGMLKIAWNLPASTKWKFATPFHMFYAVIATATEGEDRQKTCSFKGIDPPQSYKYAMDLLNENPIFVEQRRRTNKLANYTEYENIQLNVWSKK